MFRSNQPSESVFWNTDRLKTISSLPCWDIVLTLLDGEARTTAEIAAITGRTPGALHAPLAKLQDNGIITAQQRIAPGKGRPGREFVIEPGALEKPCSTGREYEHVVHRATSAGLRLIMRNSLQLAEENSTAHTNGTAPRTSARWVQFGNLDEEDVAWIEDRLFEIMERLQACRTKTGGTRYRVAMMLVPDNFAASE